MRTATWAGVAVLGLVLSGCDARPGGEGTAPGRPGYQRTPSTVRYHGRTAEQHGQLLQDPDPQVVQRACRALHVLGPAGRPYLLQGLESPIAETRRVCLGTITVSDLKAEGEQGRAVLMKLAGDPADFRIRQIAELYIRQWPAAIPSRR